MKKGIMAIMAIIFIFEIVGCATYYHSQAVRNETGSTITEVYIRDTGSDDWGNAKNVRVRIGSDGRAVQTYDGSYVWDTYKINNATQIVFFEQSSFSETAKIGNKDIAIKDSDGLLYMKNNVPINFTTAKSNFFQEVIWEKKGGGETLVSSDPITFTVKDRLPMIIVVNQTGLPVTLIAPVQNPINRDGRFQFQPMEMKRSIDVIYSIGQARYTEQAFMVRNEDVTVTLTKRPPYVIITNNTGSTVNLVQIKMPGDSGWVGPNILNLQLNADGTLAQVQAGTQSIERRGSVPNKDSFRFWTANVNLTGNTFDIRIDDVLGNSYIKSNVQATNNDMTLTFTQADKR